MTESPIEPDEFVGAPPAGDANPDGFMSNDQSADPTAAADTVHSHRGEPKEEDA